MTPLWFHRVVAVGDGGADVRVVTRKLGRAAEVFGEDHAALVRGLQRSRGVPVTGVVDSVTAGLLGEAAGVDLPPVWWDGVVSPSDPGYIEIAARFHLDESGVRRLQGSHGLRPTGVVDLETARILDRLV